MKHEVFNLREEPINGFMPTLTTYVIDDNSDYSEKRYRPAILVCPGGGYAHCSCREAEPIALQYMAAGYCAFVLDYAVAPESHYPEPQKNASDAIRLIREHAEEWAIDKEKIAIIGFSAGGHLAASIATMWDEEPIKTKDGSNKPNAAILCYPVISSDEKFGHIGSFENLCEGDKELFEKLSLEKRVTSKTCPCFIWHTFEDDCVPVENSLAFAAALRKARVSCEMHIFPYGDHGIALANSNTAPNTWAIVERAQEWVELSVKWMNDLFEKDKLGN